MRPAFIPQEVFRSYLGGSALNKYLKVDGVQAYSFILRCERDGRPIRYMTRNGVRVYRLLDVVARARAEGFAIAPGKLRAHTNSDDTASPRSYNELPVSDSIGTQGSSYAPVSGRTALYTIEDLRVDVTDLLNADFALLDLLSDAMVCLQTRLALASNEERARYLSGTLTRAMDLQAERVFTLNRRLCEPSETMRADNSPLGTSEVNQYCGRLNDLRDRAEVIDYLALSSPVEDDFSSMVLSDLHRILAADKWNELMIRLRANRMLNPCNVTEAARWVARGLDVRHAVIKVQVDKEERGEFKTEAVK